MTLRIAYATRELPPLAVSLALAEGLFKFGSFTLEALAFLAVWWSLRRVAYAAGVSIHRRMDARRGTSSA